MREGLGLGLVSADAGYLQGDIVGTAAVSGQLHEGTTGIRWGL